MAAESRSTPVPRERPRARRHCPGSGDPFVTMNDRALTTIRRRAQYAPVIMRLHSVRWVDARLCSSPLSFVGRGRAGVERLSPPGKTTLQTRILSLAFAALAATTMSLSAGIALAKDSSGTLDAPMLRTTPGRVSPDIPDAVDYSCVSGAVKYAIEAFAIYCVAGKPMPAFYEFSSTACDTSYPSGAAFTVDLSTYTQCDLLAGCPATINPVAVAYHVKGLSALRARRAIRFPAGVPPCPSRLTSARQSETSGVIRPPCIAHCATP